jgi:ADP-ribosylglycohydrolase
MAGALAQAYYGDIPRAITREVYRRIPEEFKEIMIVFEEHHL